MPLCLIIQAAALSAVAIWLSADPTAEWLVARIVGDASGPLGVVRDAVSRLGWSRVAGLTTVLLVASGSMAWWLSSLFRRPKVRRPLATAASPRRSSGPRTRHSVSRTVRSLLIMTTFCAGWCGLAANASSLVWQGKRLRMAWSVEQLEPLAQRLREQWPQGDSQLPEIGPFTAYPFGRPSVLLLMQPPSLDREAVHVSAIERSESGALKFQLGGSVANDWAEWHPEASHPRSFVGGLQDEHRLEAYSHLGGGWYLVRYEA